jgi:hypothetical protein
MHVMERKPIDVVTPDGMEVAAHAQRGDFMGNRIECRR